MQFGGSDILKEVAAYYSARLAEYGETPRGVDWNGAESQVCVALPKLCQGAFDCARGHAKSVGDYVYADSYESASIATQTLL